MSEERAKDSAMDKSLSTLATKMIKEMNNEDQRGKSNIKLVTPKTGTACEERAAEGLAETPSADEHLREGGNNSGTENNSGKVPDQQGLEVKLPQGVVSNLKIGSNEGNVMGANTVNDTLQSEKATGGSAGEIDCLGGKK